jgi:hypothetical protein
MKKNENVENRTCEVIESQADAIDSIVHRMNSFITSRDHTRVVPLIIPTGWGKTRIAVQSVKTVFLDRKKAKKDCTIILWPQNKSHVSKEVWMRPSDWSKKYKSSAPPKEVLGWRHLLEASEDQFLYITRKSLADKCYKKSIDKTRGPIFFIIDEWHSKNLVSQYIDFKNKCKQKNYYKIAEIFWRKLLLQGKIDEKRLVEKGKKRRLFVLLVSATPIASTQHMDEVRLNAFEKDLKNVLHAFNELITIGSQKGNKKFYKNYPKLIKTESEELLKAQKKYKKKKEWELFSKERKLFLDKVSSTNCWAEEYVQRSKILVKKDKKRLKIDYDPQIYMKEQALFCGLYPKKDHQKDQTLTKFEKISNIADLSLKEKTLISLLENNKKQKFVVFCHHIGIAEHIENILNEEFGKNYAYYLRKNEFENDGFKQFNNPEDDKTLVLIVTDKHSQGVDLHKSEAWLVHYELSWNPVRIIQRFGRVWRLLNGKMTSPVAFHIPYTFSSEEEQIRRLEERWKILAKKNEQEDGLLRHIDMAPISIDVALGIRCTPSPYSEDYK